MTTLLLNDVREARYLLQKRLVEIEQLIENNSSAGSKTYSNVTLVSCKDVVLEALALVNNTVNKTLIDYWTAIKKNQHKSK